MGHLTMSTEFDDWAVTIIFLLLLQHLSVLMHNASYGDLYKHFGRSLHAVKDLISSFAYNL